MNTEQKEVSMENVNYEAEVRKVYPNAYIDSILNGYYVHFIYSVEAGVDVLLSKDNDGFDHIDDAWKSAYENLKSQGKI